MVSNVLSGAIRRLPTALSYEATRSLAERPARRPLRDRDREFLGRADVFTFGAGPRTVGWAAGSGPLVVLVHGWAGSSAQLFPLAERLITDGFTVAGFDATAHGASSGRRTSFARFSAETAEFGRHLPWTHGTPYAYVGHSAGGLLTMSAREQHGLRAARYVCLNSPRSPYPPLRAIQQILHPTARVNRRLHDYYAESLGWSWSQLGAGHAFRPLGDERLLLAYDVDDEQVSHADAEVIAPLWKECEVLKTAGLGHSGALRDPGVLDAVSRFLSR
jgi:pimeloyl-ACP methyl ester carboxylesterase